MGRKKKTTEQYKKEIYQLVVDEYSILGVYINSITNIETRHNICGHEWGISPNNFLAGNRCPNCASNAKFTYNEVKEYIKVLGYELIGKEYIDANNKLILKDKDGYYYLTSLHSLKSNYMPKRFHVSNPYTIQNIILWLILNNKPFKLLSDTYEETHKKLKWKCLKGECGEEFYSSWNEIYNQKRNCPYCSGRRVALSNCLATKNPKLALEWHPTKNGNLTPYDFTSGSGEYAWWLCNKGHEWPETIANRNNKRGCPYCAGKLASEDYNLLKDNPKLCEEWDYNKNEKNPEDYTPNSGEKVCWKCKDCGHEWPTTIDSRNGKHKTGCPECNKSKGEKKISEILLINNWIKISQDEFNQLDNKYKYNKNYYIPQMKFKNLIGLGGGLLPYDFYIPKLNLIIEYDGEFHYKPIKKI